MRRNHHNEPQSPAVALLMGAFAICFGVFWTIMAASMAPFMALFGILFIAAAVTMTVGSYKAAKKHQQNDSSAAPPVYYQKQERTKPEELRCPYCSAPIHSDDEKCEYCGSRIR